MQIVGMMVAILLFASLFVIQAFFYVKTGYSPMIAIIAALFVFLYIARGKNPN
jgi:hypothetical protein